MILVKPTQAGKQVKTRFKHLAQTFVGISDLIHRYYICLFSFFYEHQNDFFPNFTSVQKLSQKLDVAM